MTVDAGTRAAARAESLTLANGATIVVRPLQAGDEAAITSWFEGLGAETRYARFFAPLHHLGGRMTSDLARVDHIDHEAISAVGPGGDTIGIARYIRAGHSNTAEVAVAVADDWRGLGIAGLLLRGVAARARDTGIEHLTATCLASNHTVIRLLSRLGATRIGASDLGVVDLRIDLTKEDEPLGADAQACARRSPAAGRPLSRDTRWGLDIFRTRAAVRAPPARRPAE